MKPTDRRDFTPQERIGRTMGWVSRNRFQLCEMLLERMGIGPGQVPILGELRHHGAMTQRELAERTRVTAATISGTLKRMERAGLVYRSDDESDARVSIVRLTDEGVAKGIEAGKLFSKTDQDMLSGFTPEECEALIGYFERMQANVRTALEAQSENPSKGE